MTSTPNLYQIRLDPQTRQRLEEITTDGHALAKKVNHARILLLSDHGRADGHWSDPRIARALGMRVNSVARIRKRFALNGEAPALQCKARAEPPVPPKLDGHLQAHLAAICCTSAPEGHARWGLSPLAGEIRRRGLVTQVCRETVRQALKKRAAAWRMRRWCIPACDSARFVAQMEDVLDLDTAEEPLICMDEASKQLLAGLREPIPMAPGGPAKEDYQSPRHGVGAIFPFFDPIRGWHRTTCRDSRTRVDWAEEVRRLPDEDDPEAREVKLVCDNLEHALDRLALRGVPGRGGVPAGPPTRDHPHAAQWELAERGGDRAVGAGAAVPGPADQFGGRVAIRMHDLGGPAQRRR